MAHSRHPKTLQEKRSTFACPVAVRAKRNALRLPSTFDDMPVAARLDRNWKRYRSTQWLAGKAGSGMGARS